MNCVKAEFGRMEAALATGVAVVRKEFLEKHPKEVEAFMEAYKKSVDFVNEDAAGGC
ncbi:MAG: ABC transporter substrate-binding protein [[Clostridium] scindens]